MPDCRDLGEEVDTDPNIKWEFSELLESQKSEKHIFLIQKHRF